MHSYRQIADYHNEAAMNLKKKISIKITQSQENDTIF